MVELLGPSCHQTSFRSIWIPCFWLARKWIRSRGGSNSLLANASPFACCSCVKSRDSPKWRAYSWARDPNAKCLAALQFLLQHFSSLTILSLSAAPGFLALFISLLVLFSVFCIWLYESGVRIWNNSEMLLSHQLHFLSYHRQVLLKILQKRYVTGFYSQVRTTTRNIRRINWGVFQKGWKAGNYFTSISSQKFFRSLRNEQKDDITCRNIDL